MVCSLEPPDCSLKERSRGEVWMKVHFLLPATFQSGAALPAICSASWGLAGAPQFMI